MRWRTVQDLSVIVGLLAGGGCATGQSALRLDPEVIAAVRAMGEEGPASQVRGQKPEEGEPAGRLLRSLLDQPPERSTEVEGIKPAARVVATVNGEAILEQEVRAACYQQLVSIRNLPEAERARKASEIWKKALDSMIEQEVVLQDATQRLNSRGAEVMERVRKAAAQDFEKTWLRAVRENADIKSEEELREVMRAQGTSIEMMQRQWERQFISREYLQSRVFPFLDKISPPEVRDYYESHTDEFMVEDSVRWQDIFIDQSRHPNREAARQFAEILVQRIRKGDSFVKLAGQYDNGISALREDAEGVGQKRGEINPAEAEAILFQLKAGEVGPLVEVGTGFHIVRVLERQYAGKRPFDDKVQREIRGKLRSEVAQREMKRLVNELKQQAIIEYARVQP